MRIRKVEKMHFYKIGYCEVVKFLKLEGQSPWEIFKILKCVYSGPSLSNVTMYISIG
jgi:hypothetical protein